MNKTVSIVVVVLLILGGLAYLITSNRSQTLQTENKTTEGSLQDKLKDEAMMKNEGSGSSMKKDEGMMMEGYEGKVLAGKSAPLLDFQKADYDEALKSNNLVVLYFYANWCPICKIEFPKAMEAFDEITSDKVIGFRVNYNDSDTDSDEVALAKEFGVAYQHTKVFVKNGKRILKSPESWDKQRYLDEIEKVL